MNMKVWVVSHDIESYVIGVYDSEEKAKDAIEKHDEFNEWLGYSEYIINESR